MLKRKEVGGGFKVTFGNMRAKNVFWYIMYANSLRYTAFLDKRSRFSFISLFKKNDHHHFDNWRR